MLNLLKLFSVRQLKNRVCRVLWIKAYRWKVFLVVCGAAGKASEGKGSKLKHGSVILFKGETGTYCSR